MKLLYDRYRVQEFMIEDDIFNFDMDRAKRICDMIVEEGMQVGLQFGNGVRLERLDEELIRKLAAAGTHHMAIAIESASPRLQKLMRKNLKLHMVKDVVNWSRKHKINTLGFFMIGFPTETIEEMNMTIRFACETNLDEKVYKELSDPRHPVSVAMEKMKTVPEVRIIEGLALSKVEGLDK